MTTRLRVAGLFAGIGGIEQGFHNAGLETVFLNEIDDRAQRVLATHFPDVPLTGDVRDVTAIPDVDVLAAGFPCTDVSQAGRKVGIRGEQSGLVSEVFRLVEQHAPRWLVLENVSYLLRLDRGAGMRYLTSSIEALGYRWAYRVVDARAFGLPQRRQRVLFVASRHEDPRSVLFADDHVGDEYDDFIGTVEKDKGYGFYWTEGLRGLGWTHDAVPTVKGGSAIGIASPPAIWYPDTGEVGTPQIEDGERLQGFPADWTLSTTSSGDRVGHRWKQVGNAVCVPMSEWLGRRLADPGAIIDGDWDSEVPGPRWPLAAYGASGRVWRAPVGLQPVQHPYALRKFLSVPLKPLSARATAGFVRRAERGRLRFSDGFLASLHQHLSAVEG